MNFKVGNDCPLPRASMIKRKLEKLLKTTSAKLHQGKTLERIKNHPNKIAVGIGEAFSGQSSGAFDQVESEIISRINDLRTRLLASAEQITFDQIGGLKDNKTSLQQVSYTIGDICRSAATPAKWGEFQFRLIRTLRPANCLELGTNLGISGCYILSALALNKSGHLITLEGNHQFATIASENMSGLNLKNFEVITGLFYDTLPEVLGKNRLFDYVFIDGHHDKDATIKYFRMIRPALEDGTIVIFDDINWSGGMQEAWAVICDEPGVVAAFDFYKVGIIVYSSEWQKKADIYHLVL